MRYKDELIKSMKWLGDKENTLFLGQATLFSGHAISGTLTEVPKEKLIELPVMEEVQMGMAAGLSLEGYVPITIYPRFNFMMLGINQLVNHMDMLTDTKLVELTEPEQVSSTFEDAYNRNGSTVVVEWGDFYAEK